ncbi:MAG: nicotinamide riboside transporter PnuC [Thermaurantimonas sp.]
MHKNGLRYWEAVAVVFSILYTWLLADGNMWCWWFAIGASVIYIALTLRVGLFAESFLHGVYLIMAIYGLHRSGEWEASGLSESFGWPVHILAVASGGIITYGSGRLLVTYTRAKATYLDSFTTVFSLWATWLMVNFYPENWIYWIVIDAASAVLYFRGGLFMSSLLYLAYTFLALRGWILWTSG